MIGGSENGDVSPRDNGDNTTVTTPAITTQPTTTTTITSSTTSATTTTSTSTTTTPTTSTTTTPTTAAAIHTTTEQVSDHRTVDSDSWKEGKVKRANEKGSSIPGQLSKHREKEAEKQERKQREKEAKRNKEAEKQKHRTRKAKNKSQSSSSYSHLESNEQYLKKLQSEDKREFKRMDIHDRKEPTQSAEQLAKHLAEPIKRLVIGPIGRKVVNQNAQLPVSEMFGDVRLLHMRTQQKTKPSTSNEKGQHQPASTLVANDKQTVRIYSSG